MILITGAHKAFALYKAIEEGVNHMWTVSAFQQHPQTMFVCDEDATLELKVKTVKYFQGESFTALVTTLKNTRFSGERAILVLQTLNLDIFIYLFSTLL